MQVFQACLHGVQVFGLLPASIRDDLLRERDPHGNVQVGRPRELGLFPSRPSLLCISCNMVDCKAVTVASQPADQHCSLTCLQVARIETEKLVLKLVEEELARRTAGGSFSAKFNAICHYFGYEGRCSLPSNFDSAWVSCLHSLASVLQQLLPAALWLVTLRALSSPLTQPQMLAGAQCSAVDTALVPGLVSCMLPHIRQLQCGACRYCSSLGRTAAALIAAGKTGLMATVSQLGRPAREWTLGGTPLTSLMCLERRKGK